MGNRGPLIGSFFRDAFDESIRAGERQLSLLRHKT